MLNIDFYTLSIQIANFLFLLLLLNIIVFRPIRNILSKRKEQMSSSEDATQTWIQKANKGSEELEANISDTRKRGIKERDSLKSEGMDDEQKMLKEIYSVVEDKLDKARAELEKESLKARDSLNNEVNGFAADLAEKLLGRGI
jgi:F-type H+-transporting ATPase subunit b